MLKSLLLKMGLRKKPVKAPLVPIIDYTYAPDENHIELLNFWTLPEPKELWFYRYVMHHFSRQLAPDNALLLSCVFGPRQALALSESRHKVFYTCENVDNFPEYTDHCRGIADLILGFDYLDWEEYHRFPLWILYFFNPGADRKSIQETLDGFVQRDICDNQDKKFASMIVRHDRNNNKARTVLFNALGQIDRVDSAGAYLNNTNDLTEKYADDKLKFIGMYKFNICPENTNREGYVTEKVFEAFKSNTIPVYWGSNNNPEPEVLNRDAILFYDGPHSLGRLNKQVEELHRNPKLYQEFVNQPRFQPHAAEYIADAFHGLYIKLDKLLGRK